MASAAVDRNRRKHAVYNVVFDAGAQVHGAIDNFILSPTIDWPNSKNDTLAQIMTSYHMSFIMHHDPNVAKSQNAPHWLSYLEGGVGGETDGESVGFSTLDVTYSSIELKRDPDEGVRCDFFAAQVAVVAK